MLRAILACSLWATVAHADYGRTPRVPPPPAPKILVCHPNVKPVVVAETWRVRECFVRARARDPQLAGTVIAQFTIRNGRVVASAATGLGAIVEHCVAHAMAHVRFPNPREGFVVHYPFTLE